MSEALVAASVAVLIVEDEALIRMLAVDIAAQEGFVAWDAQDVDSAMSVLTGQHAVRLVFTDIDMPGDRNGLALAWTVHKRWPSIQLVITSGKMRPDASEMPAGSLFLPKPYTADDLARALDLAREPKAME